MNPSQMPRKAAPVRVVTRMVDRRPVCDYERTPGSVCGCEGFVHSGVERVLALRPLNKPNRSMAAAIRKAGLR